MPERGNYTKEKTLPCGRACVAQTYGADLVAIAEAVGSSGAGEDTEFAGEVVEVDADEAVVGRAVILQHEVNTPANTSQVAKIPGGQEPQVAVEAIG